MQLQLLLIYVISSVITQLTHPLHLNPPLNRPIPPHLSLTLPVSLLNSSKSDLLYNMSTISTLYLFLNVSTWYLKPLNIKWDQNLFYISSEQPNQDQFFVCV